MSAQCARQSKRKHAYLVNFRREISLQRDRRFATFTGTSDILGFEPHVKRPPSLVSQLIHVLNLNANSILIGSLGPLLRGAEHLDSRRFLRHVCEFEIETMAKFASHLV